MRLMRHRCQHTFTNCFQPRFVMKDTGQAATAAFEDSLRRQREIHAVFLDIRKAYDSVCRILGKDVALRRLGFSEDVIELFTEIDRGNRNRLRTEMWLHARSDRVAIFMGGVL